jgi:hypothetical protein
MQRVREKERHKDTETQRQIVRETERQKDRMWLFAPKSYCKCNCKWLSTKCFDSKHQLIIKNKVGTFVSEITKPF